MIKAEVNGGIAEIRLSVNKVNALNIDATFQLADLFEATGRREDVKVILLSNEGDSFCAGADIKEIGREPDLVGKSNRAWHRLTSSIYDCEVPVIAAVDGHCLGGGLALAASCDIIFLSERTRIGLPQIKSGGWGASTFLLRLVGPMRMRAIGFSGRTLTAAELAGSDGVHAVLPSQDIHAAALDMAKEIAQYSGEALRMGKAAMNGIDPFDLKHSYRFEHAFTTELFVSREAATLRKTLSA